MTRSRELGGRNRYWHLLIGRPNKYHPSFVGTLREAVAEATSRAIEEKCSVRVAYNPSDRVSSASRTVAVVAWTKDGPVVEAAPHSVERKVRRRRRAARMIRQKRGR